MNVGDAAAAMAGAIRRWWPLLCSFLAVIGALHYALRRAIRYEHGSAPLSRREIRRQKHSFFTGNYLAAKHGACCLTGHWLIGAMNTSRDFDLDDMASRIAPDEISASGDDSVPLSVNSATGVPLRVVPRVPHFLTLRRPALLPPPPDGSLHLERPPQARFDKPLSPSCLRTRAPPRERAQFERLTEWTIEAVVLFLHNPHFGTQWQTIFGRNGYNMTGDGSDAALTSLALKVSPGGRLLLQAWLSESDAPAGAPARLVSAWSVHGAQANAWYHIVVTATKNGMLHLQVNGFLEASVVFNGRLAHSPRRSDGDLTFGCGMFDGVPADTCSCLISEVRASNRSLPAFEWLWVPMAILEADKASSTRSKSLPKSVPPNHSPNVLELLRSSANPHSSAAPRPEPSKAGAFQGRAPPR